MSWLTTNSSLGDLYIFTHLLVSSMVPMKEPPYRQNIWTSLQPGMG